MRSCLARRIWRAASYRNSFLNATPITATPCLAAARCHAPAHTHAQIGSTQRRTTSTNKSIERLAADDWVALLDHHLPPQLRVNAQPPKQEARYDHGIAGVILGAQRDQRPGTGIDLLVHLGMHQERWRAVLWLVKHLVDAFAVSHAQPRRLASTLCPWTCQESLDDITSHEGTACLLNASLEPTSAVQTLDELTDELKPENMDQKGLLRHEVLGSIWRSLGVMSIACTDAGMRPEVLEILAYLHHMEVMPPAVYSRRHSSDITAVQQPPMLNLFSSAILTSLSDAAWRAHEKLAFEEVCAKAGQNLESSPSPPGAAVRTNTAQLRPEIWIEFILWSCLHGGWISEGSAILQAMCSESEERSWKPLSWNALSFNAHKHENWDELAHLFNTSRSTTREQRSRGTSTSIRRTISGEVVTAFVDASLIALRVGVGARGTSPHVVLNRLSFLHGFLQRSHLTLQTGSWDAVILRFFDTQETIVDQGKSLEKLLELSPGIGEELNTDNRPNLPEYVLDGSAATLGLYHRALQSRIAQGDFRGAVSVFARLQDLSDRNKQQSVVDFFRKAQQSTARDSQGKSDMFTGNFPGIEHPTFSVQVPPTVLGPFMELICNVKAYAFGKWLLYSDQIDDPVLLERFYGHPAIAPALLQFAAETSDTGLLANLIRAQTKRAGGDESALPRNLLRSFFESQISLLRWDAAERVLQHMDSSEPSFLTYPVIAHMIRIMLSQVRGARTGDSKSLNNLARAKALLSSILQGQSAEQDGTDLNTQEQNTLLLAMISTLDQEWARYCLNIQSLYGVYPFRISAKAFNMVLEGAVDAYGSDAGRKLIDRFWPLDVQRARRREQVVSRTGAGEVRLSRFMSSTMEATERQRAVITIPGHPELKIILYGGLDPNVMTIRIVLRQACKECAAASKETADPAIFIWAVRALRSLRMTDEDIKDEIQKELQDRELQYVREQFSELFAD